MIKKLLLGLVLLASSFGFAQVNNPEVPIPSNTGLCFTSTGTVSGAWTWQACTGSGGYAGVTSDGANGLIITGNVLAASYTTASSTFASYLQLKQGTSPGIGGTSTIRRAAPATVSTPYLVLEPSAPATGIPHWSNSAGVVTTTVSAVDLSSSDVTGNMGVTHLNNGTGASSTTAWFGDGTWKSVTSTPSIPRPQSRQWAMTVHADGSCTTCTGTGDSLGTVGTSAVYAGIAATSTTPPYRSMQTKVSTPTSGDAAGNSGQPQFVSGKNILLQSGGKISSTITNIRWFYGAGKNSLNTGGDTPNVVSAAFRYSTGASDPAIMCVVGDGASHNQAVSSAVAADTNNHQWQISENSSTGHWLFSIDGVQVCDISGSGVPPAGNTMSPQYFIVTLTSAQAITYVSYMYEEWDVF